MPESDQDLESLSVLLIVKMGLGRSRPIQMSIINTREHKVCFNYHWKTSHFTPKATAIWQWAKRRIDNPCKIFFLTRLFRSNRQSKKGEWTHDSATSGPGFWFRDGPNNFSYQAREEEMRRTFLLITEITQGISLPFPFEHIVCGWNINPCNMHLIYSCTCNTLPIYIIMYC